MEKVVSSNCRRCPYYKNKKCDGEDKNCICKFCPRNLGVCISTRWCKETESALIFD